MQVDETEKKRRQEYSVPGEPGREVQKAAHPGKLTVPANGQRSREETYHPAPSQWSPSYV